MMRKIQAGALQLTLFICVVIALLLAAFIILIHTHKRFNLLSDLTIETVKNSDNGVTYALSNAFAINDSTHVELTSDIESTLKVYRSYWGVFEKVSSHATIKTKQFDKIALIGGIQPKNTRTALYLEDNNKPLVVVGNTKIKGDAYLSKLGVKPGNISGTSYYGQQLIYGTTKVTGSFPKPANELLQNLNYLQRNISRVPVQNILNIQEQKVFKNSFSNARQYVLGSTDITLTNVTLIGHILIKSESRIIVDASANLKDVVLIAPRIEIKDNVVGTFQAIATKNIVVGKNCTLKYPSALVVNHAKSDLITNIPKKDSNKLLIGTNSSVGGIVLYLGYSKLNNTQTQVTLEESSIITGEVYCNQNLELKGSVYGTVFTKNFMANQFGSIYQNHIYNGRISVTDLPKEYVGLCFKNQQKGVLKWLY